jgi:hypothetical protein
VQILFIVFLSNLAKKKEKSPVAHWCFKVDSPYSASTKLAVGQRYVNHTRIAFNKK